MEHIAPVGCVTFETTVVEPAVGEIYRRFNEKLGGKSAPLWYCVCTKTLLAITNEGSTENGANYLQSQAV
jgi:hypothetical protein